jgi:DNA-binding HxlR family transcriptional regulator
MIGNLILDPARPALEQSPNYCNFTCILQVQIYNHLLAKCKYIKIIFMPNEKKRSNCPVSCSLDIWGDRWSLLIIRDLMMHNKRTYGDFLKADEGIATNILAARLLSLEENGLIEKLEHPDSKAKVLYRLTQKGIDLFPVMIEINLWAEKYFAIPAERRAELREVKRDKAGYVKAAMKELERGSR